MRPREEWRKALEQTRRAWHDAFYRLLPVSDRLRPFARLLADDGEEEEALVLQRRSGPPIAAIPNDRGRGKLEKQGSWSR